MKRTMATGNGTFNTTDYDEGSAMDSVYGSANDIMSGFNDMNESMSEFDENLHLCKNSSFSPSCSGILDNRHWSIRGEVHHPILAVLYALFFLVSFGWNIFILVVMIKKRTTFQLPAHVAIFALTVANVCSCITIILPLFVVQCTQEWVFFGADCHRCNICKIQGAIVVLLVDFALHVLALMSFDRMLLLLKPLTYRKYITKKRMLGLVIVLLVLCILIVTPPFYGFGEIEFNRNLGTCLPRFTGDNGNKFYIGFCLIEAMFPMVTLVIASVITYRIIVRTLRTNHLRRKSLHRRKSMQEIEEVSHHKGQQQQLAKVFGAFLIAYIFAWSPIVVVGFVFVFSDDSNNYKVPGQIFVFGFFCYLSNVLFQPILETLFISDLRTQLRGVKSSVTESIRTGTNVMIRKGSQLSRRISDFHSSLTELSSSTIESPLPTHRTRSMSMNKSPVSAHTGLRRSHSDSGYNEGSIHSNGILVNSNSNRSLNKLLRKKTRFDFNDGNNSPDTLRVCLETIPESGTLERRAARSPGMTSTGSSDSMTDREGSVEPIEKDLPLEDEDVFTPSTPNAVNQIHTLDITGK